MQSQILRGQIFELTDQRARQDKGVGVGVGVRCFVLTRWLAWEMQLRQVSGEIRLEVGKRGIELLGAFVSPSKI